MRYLLFVFDIFPEQNMGGGWNDFKGAFDSIEEAVAAVKGFEANGLYGGPMISPFYQVVDAQTLEIVRSTHGDELKHGGNG